MHKVSKLTKFFLLPFLTLVLLAPTLAERPGKQPNRGAVRGPAPGVSRPAPRQVQRAPRQVQRAPRQVQRAPRQVQRAPRQVQRPRVQAPSRPAYRPQAPSRRPAANRPVYRPQRPAVSRPAANGPRVRPQRPAAQNRPNVPRVEPQRPAAQSRPNGPRVQPQRPAAQNRPNVPRVQPQRPAAQNRPNAPRVQRPVKGPVTWPNLRPGDRPQTAAEARRRRGQVRQPANQSVRRPIARPDVNRNGRPYTNRPVVAQPNVSGSYNNYNYNYNYNYTSAAPSYSYSRNVWAPAYSFTPTYNPYLYANYWDRRAYRRRYFSQCSIPFLTLGFFFSRPYSSYDYSYNRPYYYGDDVRYQAATGGPAQVASQADVAPPSTPDLDTTEARMLASVSRYVEQRSQEGSFQIADSALENRVWSLDLAQAPAVFEIEDGLYSVVAGFEGTLEENGAVPSNVIVEFFVARTADGFDVKDAWITSANGIPRAQLYQSPVYPQVKTWQAGEACPFTGQPMIPIPDDSSELPEATGEQHG